MSPGQYRAGHGFHPWPLLVVHRRTPWHLGRGQNSCLLPLHTTLDKIFPAKGRNLQIRRGPAVTLGAHAVWDSCGPLGAPAPGNPNSWVPKVSVGHILHFRNPSGASCVLPSHWLPSEHASYWCLKSISELFFKCRAGTMNSPRSGTSPQTPCSRWPPAI